MEKLVDVCFILIDNPFGAALPKGESDEGSNEGVPRIIRNQILIRGAPVVARSLTAAGTATMAAGIAIRSKPVKTKQFLHVSKRHRIDLLKYTHGRKWKQAWRLERRKYVHYNPRGRDVTAQQGRALRKQQAGRNLTATTLRGAGGVLYVAGRLVPTIAASMVVGSYFKTKEGDRPPTQIDIMSGNVRPDLGGLSQDVSKIHAMNLASIEQGVFLVSTSYYLGKAAVGEIL